MDQNILEAGPVRSPEVIAAEIRYIVQKARETLLSGAIEIGRRLVEAKELVPYGQWEVWLQENVSYSSSTANNLMAIYREYGSDQQSLFDKASAVKSKAELSYSKAVALLVLPREQREEFLAQHPVEEMSTRQLQEAIRQTKQAQQERDAAIDQGQKLKAQLDAGSRSLEQEQKARQKAEAKAKKLQDRIQHLEQQSRSADQQALDKAAEEAAEKAKAETQSQLARLREQLAKAEKEKEQIAKRLDAAGSQELTQARLLLQNLQQDFNCMLDLAAALERKDRQEDAKKLRSAIRKLCGKICDLLPEEASQ